MLAYTTDRLRAGHTPPTPEQIAERKRQLWQDHIDHLRQPPEGPPKP